MLRPNVATPRIYNQMTRLILTRVLIGGLAALAFASVAAARDYIVVASTDPGVARGQPVDGGQRLAVNPGRSVTLMHASGDLLVLKGAAGGVVAPARRAADTETARLEVFRTMVATKPREQTAGLGARRTRGGVCPAPESLTSLDAIAQVGESPCQTVAVQALDAWLAANIPPEQ